MFEIGIGRLKLSPMWCTDGIVYYTVYSPSLQRIMKHKKRDLSVVGKWLCVGSIIVWFVKERR